VSLVLPFTITMSPLYPVVAVVLGAMFVIAAEQLRRDPTPERAIRLFTFSNTYLALLFAAVAVDTFLVG
jgi:protoheme IX farnesyltransferase